MDAQGQADFMQLITSILRQQHQQQNQHRMQQQQQHQQRQHRIEHQEVGFLQILRHFVNQRNSKPAGANTSVSAENHDAKPSCSYIGLIAKAILSSPEKRMVLSEIYQWIQHNYPYFRAKGPGWRNSIRHNLSLNDCFVKIGRSANGKGHYWGIHSANVNDFMRGDFRRRRAQRRVRRAMGIRCSGEDSDDSLLEETSQPSLFYPGSVEKKPDVDNLGLSVPSRPFQGQNFSVENLLGLSRWARSKDERMEDEEEEEGGDEEEDENTRKMSSPGSSLSSIEDQQFALNSSGNSSV